MDFHSFFFIIALNVVHETCAEDVLDRVLALKHSAIQGLLASKSSLSLAEQSQREHDRDTASACSPWVVVFWYKHSHAPHVCFIVLWYIIMGITNEICMGA